MKPVYTIEWKQIEVAFTGLNQEMKQTMQEVSQALRNLIKSGFYGRMSLSLRCAIHDTLSFFQMTEEVLQKVLNEEASQDALNDVLEQIRAARKQQNLLQIAWKANSKPNRYSEERFLVIAHVYRECDTLFYSLEKLEALVAKKSLVQS